MLVTLDDKQKQDLALLASVDAGVAKQFCDVAINSIKTSQPVSKPAAVAAKKMGVSAQILENCINALCFLFKEAARYNLGEFDFTSSLVILGLDESINSEIKQVYLKNRDTLRSILSQMTFDLPHYVDLDWRLDVQIGSRTMRDQVQPVFLLRLDTAQGEEQKSQFLQTDYNNLKHLLSEMEAAMDELKTAYARRIGRNL